jgi:flagellar hook assembly protein FlgD
LRIYDVAGQLQRVLWQGLLPAGGHRVAWDGRNKNGAQAASGVYFYVLETAEKRLAQKMLLLR